MIYHKGTSVLGMYQDFGLYENIVTVDGKDSRAGGPSSSS